MSTLNVDKVDPSTGTTLELGTSGDTVNLGSGVTAGTGFGGDLSFGGDTFGANKVIGANDAYSFSLETSGNTALTIDANGIITKPLQPCVLVHPSDDAQNPAISPGSDWTVVFDTERFDQNADFSSNTFTAPVTGKYLFNFSLNLQGGIPTTPNYIQIKPTTSNKTYYCTIDPDAWDSSPAYWNIPNGIIADMDASDTMTLVYYEQGSHSAATVIGWTSWMSISLLC